MDDSIKETLRFFSEIENNELYKKSKSRHKSFQLRQYTDPFTGDFVNGRQTRMEDANGLIEGQKGFNEESAKEVTFNFKDGVLQSENGKPAIQYSGHSEFWNRGLIVRVVADNGDVEEFWENGIPVRIESNLIERREKGEKI